MALAVALSAAIAAGDSSPRPWSVLLGIGRIQYPGLVLDDLQIRLRDGGAAVDIGALTLGDVSVRGLELRCAVFEWHAELIRCQQGSLRAPEPLSDARAEFAIRPDGKSGQLTVGLAGGGRLAAELASDGVKVRIEGFDLRFLKPWLPDLAAWSPSGTVDCTLAVPANARSVPVELACTLTNGAFSSSDGQQAGAALVLDLVASARPAAHGGNWQAQLDWRAGELYVHPIYVPATAKLSARGVFAADRIGIEHMDIAMAGVGALSARGDLRLAPFAIGDMELAVEAEDLAVFGPRFLVPLLAPALADKLTFEGRAHATATLAMGRPTALAARLAGVSIGHSGFDFALGPASGELSWRDDGAGSVRLDIAGGHWQALDLGAFGIAARADAESVSVAPVAIPVLDGRLRLEDLAWRRDAGGWYGEGRAAIDPIAMPRLSAALGLPVMGGALSAELPRVRVRPGEIVAEGEIAIALFDGAIAITGLRLIEPFGVGAYVRAEAQAKNIDLGMLTDSFDFGSIAGRIDARVHRLELANWRPVRFDARVESSPGRYRRRISQRALQNIGAFGGAGVVNAIQRSALKYFDSFGYRRIGLSCVLENGVCVMDGIEPGRARPDGGFLIIQGGGVPALDVVGYNRRVDWDELITRLARVTTVETAPVVE